MICLGTRLDKCCKTMPLLFRCSTDFGAIPQATIYLSSPCGVIHNYGMTISLPIVPIQKIYSVNDFGCGVTYSMESTTMLKTVTPYFVQKYDASGRMGLSSIQKITTTLLML